MKRMNSRPAGGPVYPVQVRPNQATRDKMGSISQRLAGIMERPISLSVWFRRAVEVYDGHLLTLEDPGAEALALLKHVR